MNFKRFHYELKEQLNYTNYTSYNAKQITKISFVYIKKLHIFYAATYIQSLKRSESHLYEGTVNMLLMSQLVTRLSHFRWTETVTVFHALFQYMFDTLEQNCTLNESFLNKILNVKHG